MKHSSSYMLSWGLSNGIMVNHSTKLSHILPHSTIARIHGCRMQLQYLMRLFSCWDPITPKVVLSHSHPCFLYLVGLAQGLHSEFGLVESQHKTHLMRYCVFSTANGFYTTNTILEPYPLNKQHNIRWPLLHLK